MDYAVSILLEFPPPEPFESDVAYDVAARSHLEATERLISTEAALIAPHGVAILKLLDPAVNTISFVAVFNALHESGSLAPEHKLEDLVTLLWVFDPKQIRYVGNQFSTWLEKVASGNLLPHNIAVDVLANAILKIDPSGAMFTSHHVALVQLAYDHNVPEAAFPVIDKQTVFFPGNTRDQAERVPKKKKPLCDLSLPPTEFITVETGLTTVVTAEQVLVYELTCGLLYCSRRQWAKAHTAFERVITHPTRDGGTSSIMLEAFRKWVLVSLLVHGRSPTTPTMTGIQAQKAYEIIGKPYLSLASHFDSGSAKALKAEVEANSSIWADDHNAGLVQEVLAAHQKWQIINLRKIYSKLSVAELCSHTLSAETGNILPRESDMGNLLKEMISSGMLKGVIHRPAGKPAYLEYLSSLGPLPEKQFQGELCAASAKLKYVVATYKAANARLSSSPHYVRQYLKDVKYIKDVGQSKATAFEASIEDEDLMTDLAQDDYM